MVVELMSHAARFFLAFVFVAAGVSKLLRAEEFERAVANYRLLPRRLSRPVAVWLPRAELSGGLLLAFGVLIVPAAFTIAALLLVFSFAVGINLIRGRKMSCNCFGSAVAEDMTWLTVGRNLVLVGMALSIVAVPAGALAAWPGPGSASTVVSSSGAAAMLVTAVATALSVALAAEGRKVVRRGNVIQNRLEAEGAANQ